MCMPPCPRRKQAVLLTSVLLTFASIPAFAQTEEPPAGLLPGEKPEVSVDVDGAVEMHVSELPLSTALQLLSIESQRNIIASPAVTGTVTASLYGVSFEEALDAVLISNNAGFKEAGKFIFVYTNQELAELEAAANPPVTKVLPLSYVSSRDAKEYITPLLAEGSSVTSSPDPETGVGSESEEAGSNNSAAQDFIIVTARPAELALVESILAEIDIRPQQVLVEATILRAQLTDDNALGIDFSIVGGVDLEMLSATSNAVQNLNLGQLPADNFKEFNIAANTDFRDNVPPGGFSLGIIKDQVAVFIRALEQVTDTQVLANPKILALNKQKGQVIVGRRDGYLTTTVTETQAVQSVEFLETGTQLIFRPFIGNDGFVRVELHPEDSVGLVNAQGLPSEQTTEVTTNVIVEDGHTVLIGGLFREVTTDARSQIPFLGNLPGVGQLFRSNNDSTAREEVIILLTIHIVKDHKKYAQASAERLQNIERMRVGLRQGLMWHGKERIARMHYRKALAAFQKGDNGLTHWHIKLALHNDARFVPAIELREKLTGLRRWDDDGSNVRGFLRELVDREHANYNPHYGRPGPPFLGSNDIRGPNGIDQKKDDH